MVASKTQKSALSGFLTVIETVDQGLVGGYLLLNPAGRPTEFHCTAPVRPNRAQEILYGVTLRPYLYGEQIGRTLVIRSKKKPGVVYVDVEHALSLQEFVPIPVVYVPLTEKELACIPAAPRYEDDESHVRIDDAHQPTPSLHRPHASFALGNRTVALCAHRSDDQSTVIGHWQTLAPGFDLAEPFERIREAIREATAR